MPRRSARTPGGAPTKALADRSPLGFAGRSRGGRYWLEAPERPELAELFELLRSRPAQGGALPWALARFELGCEHPVALEGLSDHLLALRAMLDDGERSERWIARRLAALCAEPADQRAVRERLEQAFKLEQLVMRGNVDAAYMAAIGVERPSSSCASSRRTCAPCFATWSAATSMRT